MKAPWLAAAALAMSAAAAAAQAVAPQPTRYLLTTSAADARALWVNPAGLIRRFEASLGADVTVDRFASGTEVSQYGASLASRGIALGWSHDRYPGGSANWYAIGLGAGSEPFSAGVARRWFRGPTAAAYWDIAMRATSGGWLQLSAVARNVGSPAPSDSASAPIVVPGASASLFGGLLDAAAECDLVTRGWRTRSWRLGATLALTRTVALSLRADLTGDMAASGLAIAIQFEGPAARVSGFAVSDPGFNRAEAGGIAGALVARRPGVR